MYATYAGLDAGDTDGRVIRFAGESRPDRSRYRESVDALGELPPVRWAARTGVRLHHEAHIRVGQHHRDSIDRSVRIEGQVGCAGPDDAEHSHDHVDRAVHREADEVAALHASCPQLVSEVARMLPQLPKRQFTVRGSIPDGTRVWLPINPFLNEQMKCIHDYRLSLD